MKIAVITGATSGIGFATCAELLQRGFKIIGVGRNADTSSRAKQELVKNGADVNNIEFFYGDLSVQAEVRKVAEQIKKYLDDNNEGKLDVLVNNAGCVRSSYTPTVDGIEMQFAVNHLAGFIFIQVLMPCVVASKGRILFTSSGSHKMKRMHWKDVMYKKFYNPLLVYKQSKLCNMLLAYAINERFGDKGVHAYGIDPGLVNTSIGLKNTKGIVKFVWGMRQKSGVEPTVSAKTYGMLATIEPAPSDLYFKFEKAQKYSRQVNHENADRLWALSEELTKVKENENAPTEKGNTAEDSSDNSTN